MRHYRPFFSSLLILSTSVCATKAAESLAGPRASWEEPDARVLAFSQDGRTLVTSRREGKGILTRLRDAETGRVRADLTTPGVGLHSPQFSPDGRLLFATVTSDRYKPVPVLDLKAWVVATGETYATIPYVSESINASTCHFALSGDGKTLAFTDHSERLPIQVKTSKMIIDGRHELNIAYNANPGLPRVKIWDVPRWRETAVIDGGSHMVFSPDGKILVTGSRDWKVPVAKVWDAATGEHLDDLVGKAQWVKPMTFSPDGKFLAIGGSGDQTLWELATGRKWMVTAERRGFGAPVFTPDGRVLFPVGLPRLVTRSPRDQWLPGYDLSGLPPRRLELKGGQLIVSPVAGRYAAVHGRDDRTARSTIVVYTLPDLRESVRFTVDRLIDAGFSPDGRWLTVMVYRPEKVLPDAVGRYVREIRLLDPATGRVLATVPTLYPTAWNDPLWTFSPDGRTLAVSYWRGIDKGGDSIDRLLTVDLWDLPAP